MPNSTPTAERREEVLGELAEWLHAAAREAQRRLLEAETTDEFVKLAASLAKLGRGVRQSVMAQDRLEGRRLAAKDARAQAELVARRESVERHKSRVSRAVERRFEEEWPETEDLEDNEALDAGLERLSGRLDDLAEREDFLDTDADALIARLCEEFGIAPPEPSPTTSPMAPGGPFRAEAAGRANGGPAVPGLDTS